ncbi:MAG: hypothetical protein AAF721_13850 [Myxococcota bacterium]
MPGLSLEIRNMETEEQGVAEFPDAEAARAWLEERPQFIEVLRTVDRDLDPKLEASLRQAMRPLDDTERARRDELDAQRDARRREKLFAMNKQALAEERPITGAGGDVMMVLRWERGRGLTRDGQESSVIPDDIAGVALEWIRERDRWAHSKRQHVANATLTIVPASADGMVGAATAAGIVSDTSEFSMMPGFSDHEIMRGDRGRAGT